MTTRKGRAIGVLLGLGLVAAVTAAAFLLSPAGPPLQPWTPSPSVNLPASKPVAAQVVADGICRAPRNIAVDAAGRVYAICRDGDIDMLAGNAGSYSTFAAKAPGSFGIGFGPLGGFVIAGGASGLLHVGGHPEPDVLLSTTSNEQPAFGFVAGLDDFKLTPDMVFVSASDQAHRAQPANALLAHAGRGGLYRYDLRTKQSQQLIDGLQTPLAVAVGPDDAYALVAETGAYRILRYWPKGEHAGTTEVFADHLPGLVTSLSFNGSGRFWAAIAEPRSELLDVLARYPGLRGWLLRLPWSWLPLPDHSRAIAFDLDGHLVENIQLIPASGIGRLTSVVEHGPWLWIGSDQASAIARVPLQSVIATAPPPPPGWQAAPRQARAQAVKVEKDDD